MSNGARWLGKPDRPKENSAHQRDESSIHYSSFFTEHSQKSKFKITSRILFIADRHGELFFFSVYSQSRVFFVISETENFTKEPGEHAFLAFLRQLRFKTKIILRQISIIQIFLRQIFLRQIF